MAEIAGFGTLVHPDALKWIEVPGGNSLKVMRVSEETGSWTALFRAARGTTNPPHIHLGPADFYVLSGVLEYRGGVARSGDWIYEPNGAEHEATHHPEETERPRRDRLLRRGPADRRHQRLARHARAPGAAGLSRRGRERACASSRPGSRQCLTH
jgi:ChrR-like protein with cupin domain